MGLRARVPGLALTTDVIAGFPGESEAQWENTVRLCEQAGFMKLHVFPYSPRSGTQAARWPDDVPRAEKEHRCRVLQALSQHLGYQFAAAHVGERFTQRRIHGTLPIMPVRDCGVRANGRRKAVAESAMDDAYHRRDQRRVLAGTHGAAGRHGCF